METIKISSFDHSYIGYKDTAFVWKLKKEKKTLFVLGQATYVIIILITEFFFELKNLKCDFPNVVLTKISRSIFFLFPNIGTDLFESLSHSMASVFKEVWPNGSWHLFLFILSCTYLYLLSTPD